MDGSNYRQVPIGVVIPRTIEDVIQTVAVARKHGAPLLPRGGGTSLAGQSCNVAVIIDFSKYLNQIIEINPQEKYAWVQPGCVLDNLRNRANEFGLTFGPDPSTHEYCNLGGMIGNNSCGVHSMMAGRTVDNVLELDVLTYDGERMRLGAHLRRGVGADCSRRRPRAQKFTHGSSCCAINTPLSSAAAIPTFLAASPATVLMSSFPSMASTLPVAGWRRRHLRDYSRGQSAPG